MLVCLFGRSGSGKTTQSNLLKERKGFKEIVSYTTRDKREGEVDGVDYNFVTKEKFEELCREGKMLEYTSYNNNYYGTPDHNYSEEDWIAVVDIVGVCNLKRYLGEAVVAIGLEVDRDTSYNRCVKRDSLADMDSLNARINKDEQLFSNLAVADYTVNAEQEVESVYSEIESILEGHREC